MEGATVRHVHSHDGLRLFYRDFAGGHSACPVLCLPGLTRNSRDFSDLAKHLSPARRVLAPDLRGRGLSEHDPEWRNYHPGTYLRDIWSLLDELGIERVIVIGTSLGGLIAMGMAVQNADRLAAVVMNDVGPEIAPEGLARISKYTGRLPPVASWEQAIAQTKSVYGESWPGLTEQEWRKMAERAYCAGPDGLPKLDSDPAIGRAVRELGPQSGDPWQVFDALGETPTLVLRGEHSDILSEETLHRMRQRKPDLVTVTVANRGHVPLLDEPDCIEAIDNFLGSL
ncbi:MAG: alpha/beta hydrolase [Woeseia sp.]